MADRFTCTMNIGGKASKSVDAELRKAIEDVGPNEYYFPDDGTCVSLLVYEATIEAMADVVTFCREHNLEYDLQWDAKWEFNGQIEQWRPGMESPVVRYCLQDGTDITYTEGDLMEDIELTVREFLAKHNIPDIHDYVVE